MSVPLTTEGMPQLVINPSGSANTNVQKVDGTVRSNANFSKSGGGVVTLGSTAKGTVAKASQ